MVSAVNPFYNFAKDIATSTIKTAVPYAAVYYGLSLFSDKLSLKEALKWIAQESGEATKIFANQAGDGINLLTKELTKRYKEINEEFAITMVKTWAPAFFALGVVTTVFPLVYQYTYKVLEHRIGKPALVLDSKTTQWHSPLTRLFWKTAAKNEVRPIFKPELQSQIEEIIKTTQNIEKNKGYFENVILYGPPGTGKTMIAKEIAERSGMDYFMTSGAEMTQFIKRGEHVSEMNKLLDRAEKSGRPALVFFDEFEAIGKDRGLLDQAHIELQTTLLKRTGEGSKKVLLAFATNRITDLDPAVLSRAAYKIYVGNPEQEERESILKTYAATFFKPEEIQYFFTQEKVKEIAMRIKGFSGRSIFQLMNSINNKKFTTNDGKLTQEIIDQKIDLFIEQEKKLETNCLDHTEATTLI